MVPAMAASFVLIHSPSVGRRTWQPVAHCLTELGREATVPGSGWPARRRRRRAGRPSAGPGGQRPRPGARRPTRPWRGPPGGAPGELADQPVEVAGFGAELRHCRPDAVASWRGRGIRSERSSVRWPGSRPPTRRPGGGHVGRWEHTAHRIGTTCRARGMVSRLVGADHAQESRRAQPTGQPQPALAIGCPGRLGVTARWLPEDPFVPARCRIRRSALPAALPCRCPPAR
jgi:hypothetical protein